MPNGEQGWWQKFLEWLPGERKREWGEWQPPGGQQPTGEFGEMGFTRSMYWQMLLNYLVDDENRDAILERAGEMLSAGHWGPQLPLFTQVLSSYMKVQGFLPEEEPPPEMTPEEQFEWWQRKQEYQWELGARWTPQELWQREQEGLTDREHLTTVLQKYAGMWDAEQQRLLTQLTGPADWIKRWQTMQASNPFREELKQLKIGELRGRVKGLERQFPTEAQERPAPGMIFEPGIGKELWKTRGRIEKLERKEGRPEPPPAPEWLSQFVPSQIAGQPITRAPMATPSGQLWGKTPPSVLAGLGGYAEWAGHRPLEDIYAHMMEMLPEAPRGAGMQRWRPAYQWA